MLTLGTLVLALVQIARLPAERIWTTDDGNKYLLTRSVAAGAWARPALPRPRSGLDVTSRWSAIRPPFAVVHHGSLVSVYPPAFPVLSAAAYRLLGPYGLYVLPLAGGLLTMLAAAALARQVGANPVLAAALAGPLSFAFFYWTVLWEHTISTAVTVWAIVLLGRAREIPSIREPLLAGLLLASGAWVRDENLVVFGAVVGACLLDRVLRRCVPTLGLAYLAGWLPVAVWRTIVSGSPVGLHDPNSLRLGWPGMSAFLVDVASLLHTFLLSAHPHSLLLAAVVIGVGLVLGLAPRWLPRWPGLGPAALVAMAGSSLLVTGMVLSGQAPALRLIQVSGLWVFAPWIALVAVVGWEHGADGQGASFAPSRDRAGHLRWLAAITGLTLLGLCTVLTAAGAQGIHWGPRHLSPVMPLLAVLAALGVRRLLSLTRALAGPRWLIASRVSVALVLSAAFVIQLEGLWLQGRVARGMAAFTTAARQPDAGPLLTHLWWYAQLTAPVYLDRDMYGITTRPEFEAWLVRFADAGGRRFEWATQEPLDRMVDGLPVRQTGIRVVEAPGLRPLTHQMCHSSSSRSPRTRRWHGSASGSAWRFSLPWRPGSPGRPRLRSGVFVDG